MHLQLLVVLRFFYLGVVQFKPLYLSPVSLTHNFITFGMVVLICTCGSTAEDLGGGWFPALPAKHVCILLIQFLQEVLKKNNPSTELKFNLLILKGCG